MKTPSDKGNVEQCEVKEDEQCKSSGSSSNNLKQLDSNNEPGPNNVVSLKLLSSTSPPIPSPQYTFNIKKTKNPWGNMTYAELITEAINSAFERMLTTAQIYAWFVQNIPFFSDKAECKSTSGWKV